MLIITTDCLSLGPPPGLTVADQHEIRNHRKPRAATIFGNRRGRAKSNKVETVVLKNLAMNVTEADIKSNLLSHNFPYCPVEFHRDCKGTFKGTAFIKFGSPGRYSFIRYGIHSLIHSLIHSFIHSFTHSFTHSLIHSFILSF